MTKVSHGVRAIRLGLRQRSNSQLEGREEGEEFHTEIDSLLASLSNNAFLGPSKHLYEFQEERWQLRIDFRRARL